VQKTAARALVAAILGSLTLDMLTRMTAAVHKRMANAPRLRKSHLVSVRVELF